MYIYMYGTCAAGVEPFKTIPVCVTRTENITTGVMLK